MIRNFTIVRIDYKYCDFLREFDNRVIYNSGFKELRPFIGVLFEVNNFKYFAPLSSPKLKHKRMKNMIDFVRIDNGNLGVVNFNNMIPVQEDNYVKVDLNAIPLTVSELKYQNLLKSQLAWLNKNIKSIKNKSTSLYQNYLESTLPTNIRNRCCNFQLLEKKCMEFNSK